MIGNNENQGKYPIIDLPLSDSFPYFSNYSNESCQEGVGNLMSSLDQSVYNEFSIWYFDVTNSIYGTYSREDLTHVKGIWEIKFNDRISVLEKRLTSELSKQRSFGSECFQYIKNIAFSLVDKLREDMSSVILQEKLPLGKELIQLQGIVGRYKLSPSCYERGLDRLQEISFDNDHYSMLIEVVRTSFRSKLINDPELLSECFQGDILFLINESNIGSFPEEYIKEICDYYKSLMNHETYDILQKSLKELYNKKLVSRSRSAVRDQISESSSLNDCPTTLNHQTSLTWKSYLYKVVKYLWENRGKVVKLGLVSQAVYCQAEVPDGISTELTSNWNATDNFSSICRVFTSNYSFSNEAKQVQSDWDDLIKKRNEIFTITRPLLPERRNSKLELEDQMDQLQLDTLKGDMDKFGKSFKDFTLNQNNKLYELTQDLCISEIVNGKIVESLKHFEKLDHPDSNNYSTLNTIIEKAYRYNKSDTVSNILKFILEIPHAYKHHSLKGYTKLYELLQQDGQLNSYKIFPLYQNFKEVESLSKKYQYESSLGLDAINSTLSNNVKDFIEQYVDKLCTYIFPLYNCSLNYNSVDVFLDFSRKEPNAFIKFLPDFMKKSSECFMHCPETILQLIKALYDKMYHGEAYFSLFKEIRDQKLLNTYESLILSYAVKEFIEMIDNINVSKDYRDKILSIKNGMPERIKELVWNKNICFIRHRDYSKSTFVYSSDDSCSSNNSSKVFYSDLRSYLDENVNWNITTNNYGSSFSIQDFHGKYLYSYPCHDDALTIVNDKNYIDLQWRIIPIDGSDSKTLFQLENIYSGKYLFDSGEDDESSKNRNVHNMYTRFLNNSKKDQFSWIIDCSQTYNRQELEIISNTKSKKFC